MKKIFLVLVFAGMVGVTSAASMAAFAGTTVTVCNGEKDKTKHKCKKEKSCSKDKKACCKTGETSASKSCKGGSKAETKNTIVTEPKKAAQ